MAGQVTLSIAYGIDVLPENDPYVADAENVLHAAVACTTKGALLLGLIPWCIYCHLIWKPGSWAGTDNSRSDQNAELISRSPLQALCTRMVPYCCWCCEDHIR